MRSEGVVERNVPLNSNNLNNDTMFGETRTQFILDRA